MSYAIGNVVFGVDLCGFDWKALKEKYPNFDLDSVDDTEDLGIHSAYVSSGENPLWIGATLEEIDECDNVNLSELMARCEITQKVLDKWRGELAAVDPEVLEMLKAVQATEGFEDFFLTPRLMIIWSSS